MSFCEKLCVRLGNTNSAIFDILPDSFGKPSDKTEDVCSDFNVTNYEEVSTSEIITFESNSFLSMQEIIKSGNIDDLCPSSVVNELEIRTRGQHENPLWYKVRKGRITASIFHDVFTRKSNTPPQKLVERIVGNSESACVDTKTLQWGRKTNSQKKVQGLQKIKLQTKSKCSEGSISL
jgi:hypothetical protein